MRLTRRLLAVTAAARAYDESSPETAEELEDAQLLARRAGATASEIDAALTSGQQAASKDDAIDDYVAREYIAHNRGEVTGSFTGRLMELAEEAHAIDPRGKEILLRPVREVAEWELENS